MPPWVCPGVWRTVSEPREHRCIAAVNQEPSAGSVFEPFVGADMVEMPMRIDDVFQRQFMVRKHQQNSIGLGTGIDDGGLKSVFTAQNITVGLNRSDGQRLDDHTFLLVVIRNGL